jgi:catechol 2,3-dioxygenase-like lactoylglutathione lyase family enzyme
MIDRFDHLFITPTDYEASLSFYRDVLGWSVLASWGGKGPEVRGRQTNDRGAVLSGGGVKVVISEGRRAGGKQADGGARPNVHLDIHDVDARFRGIPKGKHVVVKPEDTKWGTRWFVVRDPDGNLIAFEELHGRD